MKFSWSGTCRQKSKDISKRNRLANFCQKVSRGPLKSSTSPRTAVGLADLLSWKMVRRRRRPDARTPRYDEMVTHPVGHCRVICIAVYLITGFGWEIGGPLTAALVGFCWWLGLLGRTEK